MGENIGKNKIKNLSGKYSQKLFDQFKRTIKKQQNQMVI